MIAFVLMLSCILPYSISHNQNVKDAIIELIDNSKDLQPIGKIKDILIREGIYDKLPLSPPLKGKLRVSSYYGYRIHPLSGDKKFHSGVDLAVELATPVYSAGAGTVIFAGRKGGYGRCVIIKHSFGFTSIYAHLSAYYTTKGEAVRQGQAIGFVGSTGKSTGNHLHFEIRKNNRAINPIYNEHER